MSQWGQTLVSRIAYSEIYKVIKLLDNLNQ